MSSSNPYSNLSTSGFPNIWNTLVGNLQDQGTREEMEDFAMMFASMAIASEIPVLGEIQMALQFLDFIDPYGYNQALTRSTLNNILNKQFQTIQNGQTSVINCLQSGNATSSDCVTAGITQDSLSQYAQLPADAQARRIKQVGSWATPMSPIVQYPRLIGCLVSTSPDRLQKLCIPDASVPNDPILDYYNTYNTFWNANAAAYKANADAAHAAAIAAAAQSFNSGGDSTQDVQNDGHKNKIIYLLAGIFVIVILITYLLARKVFK